MPTSRQHIPTPKRHTNLRLDVTPLSWRLQSYQEIVQSLAHRDDSIGHLLDFPEPTHCQLSRTREFGQLTIAGKVVDHPES